ncbi:MAG: serine/threonine protein kinase [Alphaproteobacteria bacterium]
MPEDENRPTSMTFEAAGKVMADISESASAIDPYGDPDLPSIAGYTLEARLGGGAGGEVYRAVHLDSDRQVAVKLLRHTLGEGMHAQRAWRELDSLQQLRLPAVPCLIGHGIQDGHLFIATEFIEGRPLDDYAEGEDLDLQARVALLAQTADAVQSIHEQGVIHRDIKPGNIIVDSHNQPVLVDFGIATLITGSAVETLTQEGQPIGSPAFMAPEQARGERNSISTRSDVYGLGATGYLLLTGDTPHDMDATLHESIRRVAQDEPRRPRDLKPSLPRPLAAILAKACSRNPADRYHSAGELATDLRRWRNHEPVEAGGLSIPQRAGRFVARHPVVSTATACAAIAILTVASTWTAVWWTAMQPYRIELASDRREARLLARNGNELDSWLECENDAILFTELVDRPDEFGGGKVAVLGFSSVAASHPAGHLCLFELDDLKSPRWTSGIGWPRIKMPEPISNGLGEPEDATFIASWAGVFDVFRESAGDEIVAIHRHSTHSANAIRVYSAAGEVLYEVWHDGNIKDGYWLPNEQLLIFCALNGEGNIRKRDAQVEEDDTSQPVVVFAIHPTFKSRVRQYIHTAGGKGTIEPFWSQCLLPLEAVNQLASGSGLHLDLASPAQTNLPRSCFRLTVTAIRSGGKPSINFTLDIQGTELEEARLAGDSYQSRADLPDWRNFEFSDIPPLGTIAD